MTGEITRITEKLEQCTSFGINLQLEMEEYMYVSFRFNSIYRKSK